MMRKLFHSQKLCNCKLFFLLLFLQFMQSGLTLKVKEAYSKNASAKLFTNYVKKIASLLGSKHKTLSKISDLYQFEKRIAHVSMHTYIHTHTHTHTHTSEYTHTYTYTHTYIYT